jgi:hypothetical protein
MRLEEITTGISLSGVEPSHIVSVVATVPVGEGSIQLIYRNPDGVMKERMLARSTSSSSVSRQRSGPFRSTATVPPFS